jgi:hypothetical protein
LKYYTNKGLRIKFKKSEKLREFVDYAKRYSVVLASPGLEAWVSKSRPQCSERLKKFKDMTAFLPLIAEEESSES